MSDIDRIIQALNEQKGESIALTCRVVALLRGITMDQRSAVVRAFDTECESARVGLLHSGASDEVIRGFETALQALNGLRVLPPKDDGRNLA